MAEPKKQAGGFAYHPIYGKSGFMYSPDLTHPVFGVLARFPDDWKDRPWTAEEIDAWKKRRGEPAPTIKAEMDVAPPSVPTVAAAPKKRGGRPPKRKPAPVEQPTA